MNRWNKHTSNDVDTRRIFRSQNELSTIRSRFFVEQDYLKEVKIEKCTNENIYIDDSILTNILYEEYIQSKDNRTFREYVKDVQYPHNNLISRSIDVMMLRDFSSIFGNGDIMYSYSKQVNDSLYGSADYYDDEDVCTCCSG